MHLSTTLLLTFLPASLLAYPSNRLDDILSRDIKNLGASPIERRGNGKAQGKSQAKGQAKGQGKAKGKGQGKGNGNAGNATVIVVTPTAAPVVETAAPVLVAPPAVAPPAVAPPAVAPPAVEAPAEGEEEEALPGMYILYPTPIQEYTNSNIYTGELELAGVFATSIALGGVGPLTHFP